MSSVRRYINAEVKQDAKKIAEQLDRADGQNRIIIATTWKKYAVPLFNANDNVTESIDIKRAEKSIAYYIARETQKTGNKASDIGEKWQQELSKELNLQTQKGQEEKPVPKRVEKPSVIGNIKNKMIKSQNIIDNAYKNKVIHSMYTKWSKKYKNSNLGISFYNKLYDFIKQIHCEIEDKNFDRKNYSTKLEQTMDEVIAVFAGESSLNSKAICDIYRGIFQLDADSLTTVKRVAREHNIKGVSQKITLEGFANLPGEQQLDYLVSHVAFGRERSGLTQDEKISPQQLWAIIKKPIYGQKNSKLAQQKLRVINRIFVSENIERGIA